MVTTPKRDKREAILEAMLDLIVERGFHNAPMSLVSKRSRASAGVIYHYFPSKEELIHALYRRVRSLKRDVFLEGYSAGSSPREAFITVWTNGYKFYRTQIRETRFLDLYENSSFSKHPDLSDTESQSEARAQFLKVFRAKKAGGVLKDLPQSAIDEMSFGLASRLAKREEAISPAMLKKVAEAAWDAIAGD